MNKILQAAKFAKEAHRGQKRKFTGVDYITHPARVAGRVTIDMGHYPQAEELIQIAWLHDVIEDCEISHAELKEQFGSYVADGVQALTNPSKQSDGNRAARKAMDRDHISKQLPEIKIIKMIDRLDNLKDMRGAPGGFRKKYAEESRLLLQVLKNYEPYGATIVDEYKEAMEWLKPRDRK